MKLKYQNVENLCFILVCQANVKRRRIKKNKGLNDKGRCIPSDTVECVWCNQKKKEKAGVACFEGTKRGTAFSRHDATLAWVLQEMQSYVELPFKGEKKREKN